MNLFETTTPKIQYNKFPVEQKLLALSWKQPFGTAMLHDKVETRTWGTDYRGWVMICLSKMAYDEQTAIIICGASNLQRMCQIMDAGNYKYTLDLNGYAIATGLLINCHRMQPKDEERTFVKYRPELYCHYYSAVRAIKPFVWKGSQGWREVSEEIKSQIEFI